MSKENSLMTDVVDVFSAPTAAQVVVVEARAEHKVEHKQQIQFHELGFKKHNKLFSDGRIFGGYDSDGVYYAVTVSPYFEEFYTQIEKGVQPLVFALKEKGFLTCGSCYGHPMRTMVTLCFPSVDTRREFAENISDSGIPTLHVKFMDSLVNVGVEVDRGGNVKFSRNIEFDRTLKAHLDQETESFNNLFLRSFERYYFLQIVLVGDYKWYRNPVRLWQTKQHLDEKDKLINSLTDLILSDIIPQQKY